MFSFAQRRRPCGLFRRASRTAGYCRPKILAYKGDEYRAAHQRLRDGGFSEEQALAANATFVSALHFDERIDALESSIKELKSSIKEHVTEKLNAQKELFTKELTSQKELFTKELTSHKELIRKEMKIQTLTLVGVILFAVLAVLASNGSVAAALPWLLKVFKRGA